jgi:glycerol-3-phosphate acyltransferase PlsY
MSEAISGIILSYLLGSVPFGVIVTRVAKGVDVRQYGSFSSGFTNVYRVAGTAPALVVALLDIAKGLTSTAVISPFMFRQGIGLSIELYAVICGCAAVLGHMYTAFAGFKGGKGVLTALGVCLALAPLEVCLSFMVFAVAFALTRYISAGSLTAAAAFPGMLLIERFLLGRNVDSPLLVFAIVLFVLIAIAHRKNIVRLARGVENKFERIDV